MPKAVATRAERRASRDAGAIAPYSGLQLAYAALIAAVSVASGLQAQQRGSLYGGRSVAHVWWYGWVTALSTGLGAIPVATEVTSEEPVSTVSLAAKPSARLR